MDSLANWINYRRPATWGLCSPTGALGQQLYWGWFAPRCAGVGMHGRPVRVGRSSWLLRYYSAISYRPDYYVYRDGVLYMRDRTGHCVVHTEPGEKANIDVFDDADTAPGAATASRQQLCWGAASGADAYRIEEKINGTWTVRVVVPHRGEGQYRFTTRPLEDVTTHEFRVISIDKYGAESSAATRNIVMVRPPDAPSVTYTYAASTGNVTIAAAT